MRLFFAFLFGFFLVLSANAQRLQLNEKTVVKDSSGTVYPYAIWTKLLMKGYEIRPVDANNKNTEFLLVKLSPEALEAKYNRMRPRESKFFRTGEKFMAFEGWDVNGQEHKTSKLKGKIVVINFWFVDCPPCRQEIPDLNELVDSFRTSEVVFLAVALDREEKLKTFLKTMPFQYASIYDGQPIARQYGITSYPTHVIVDQEGKVYFHTSGLAPSTVFWIRKSIKELLAKENKTASVPAEVNTVGKQDYPEKLSKG